MNETTSDDVFGSYAFWLWARIAFIALCLLVGSAIGMGGCGCSPLHVSKLGTVREASAQELRSVVTLVTPSAQWRAPALSDASFGESSGSPVLVYAPYCNAFAVRVATPDSAHTQLVLVTAAHCLARVRLAVGDDVRYQEPSGWGLGSARVTRLDVGRDYAELRPRDAVGLVPLELGATPEEGAFLNTPSSYFGESVSGRVYARAGNKVAFGGRIAYGWSGSPVLDMYGRAVGVVTRCVLSAGAGSPCAQGVIAGLL